MQHPLQPEIPADNDSVSQDAAPENVVAFDSAPELKRDTLLTGPVTPLSPEAAAEIEGRLRGVDNVTIRVLGEDPSSGRDVAMHLKAKGFSVEVIMAERMMPPPLHRHVFRYQGRTAILTIAPDMP